jgi:hypothetical protein
MVERRGSRGLGIGGPSPSLRLANLDDRRWAGRMGWGAMGGYAGWSGGSGSGGNPSRDAYRRAAVSEGLSGALGIPGRAALTRPQAGPPGTGENRSARTRCIIRLKKCVCPLSLKFAPNRRPYAPFQAGPKTGQKTGRDGLTCTLSPFFLFLSRKNLVMILVSAHRARQS